MSTKMLHLVISILMSGLTSGLPLELETRHRRDADDCIECNAGLYRASCDMCHECPDSSFTNKTNKEYSCTDCFMDCIAEMHLQVVSPCTKQADVVCECMKGFVCLKRRYKGPCTKCEQQPPSQTVFHAPAQTFSHTVSPTAPEQTTFIPSAWITHPPLSTPSTLYEKGTVLLIFLILTPCCTVFCIIMFCFYKTRKDCLKKRLKKCSLRKHKEEIKAISSEINKPITPLQARRTHTETPSKTNTDDSTPQPASGDQPSSASGKLGPLYIYGASTVFVSLLNQFGLNGGDKEEEDIRQQPLNSSEMHGPPSPTIPLSKEERSRDISFPSQEQGKECHMSKEEGL